MAFPRIMCAALGSADFILVLLPAAMITAANRLLNTTLPPTVLPWIIIAD